MKNSYVYTALAAFIAFTGAAVYAVLFYLGFLPTGFLFAQTGAGISVIVLILLTLSAIYCKEKSVHCLHGSLACFGKTLIFAAVAALCISVLLQILPTEATPLYTFILFLTVFFWKFLLIIWAFSLAVSLPGHCHIDHTVCTSADTAENTAENSCTSNRRNNTNCYTNSRYNY